MSIIYRDGTVDKKSIQQLCRYQHFYDIFIKGDLRVEEMPFFITDDSLKLYVQECCNRENLKSNSEYNISDENLYCTRLYFKQNDIGFSRNISLELFNKLPLNIIDEISIYSYPEGLKGISQEIKKFLIQKYKEEYKNDDDSYKIRYIVEYYYDVLYEIFDCIDAENYTFTWKDNDTIVLKDRKYTLSNEILKRLEFKYEYFPNSIR